MEAAHGAGVGVEYHIRAMALKNGAPRHRNLKSFAFLARAAECSHALLPTQTRAQTRSETGKNTLIVIMNAENTGKLRGSAYTTIMHRVGREV